MDARSHAGAVDGHCRCPEVGDSNGVIVLLGMNDVSEEEENTWKQTKKQRSRDLSLLEQGSIEFNATL